MSSGNISASVPFGVDRNLGVALGDQVADGLRKCILSGRYKAGDVLPSLGDLVAALGVSQRVARDGIQRIVADGLAVVRPRSGCRVLARGEDSRRGRVLGVFSDKQRVSYHYALLIPEIERAFRNARYDFETVYVPTNPNGARDMSVVSDILRSPFSLVISLYAPRRVEELLWTANVPYVPIGSSRGVPAAALKLEKDISSAEVFADRCQSFGVRTAWVATYATCESRIALGKALESVGIAVEWNRIPPHSGFGHLERLERSGFEDASLRLGGRGKRPDVMVVMDDYYLRGVLSAIAMRGLHMPDDIRVVGLVNEGFRPVSPVPLACFVVDARSDANNVASVLLAHLEGKSIPHSCYSRLEFQDGPSLGR